MELELGREIAKITVLFGIREPCCAIVNTCLGVRLTGVDKHLVNMQQSTPGVA